MTRFLVCWTAWVIACGKACGRADEDQLVERRQAVQRQQSDEAH